MSRRLARECAFKYIYAIRVNGADKESTKLCAIEQINEDNVMTASEELLPADKEFFSMLIEGVAQHQEEINKIIVDNLKKWKEERVFKVDIAVLELAIFELKYTPNIPYKAVINEAVELAKKYGNDDSAKFVNGILASVIKTMEENNGN